MKYLALLVVLAGCFHGSSSPAAHAQANRYNAYVSGAGALTILGGFVVENVAQPDEEPGPGYPFVLGGIGLIAVGVGGLLLNEALGVE